jgi:hypothetical protein
MQSTHLSLNVVFTISKNNGNYFVETIKIHNDKINQQHLFAYKDQPIIYHSFLNSKIDKKKSKQLIYITLTGDDLLNYFNIVNQTFQFNGVKLKAQSNDGDTKYECIEDPKVYIDRFNKMNKEKDDFKKIELLLESIKKEDYNLMLSKVKDGYAALCNFFIDHYYKKHVELGKSLFKFDTLDKLAVYIEKRTEYFVNYTQIKFDEYFNLIKMDLDDDIVNFFSNLNVNNLESLRKAAEFYDKIKQLPSNSIPPANVNQIVGAALVQPALVQPTAPLFTYSKQQTINIIQSETLNKNKSSLSNLNLPESWMNKCAVVQPNNTNLLNLDQLSNKFKDNVTYHVDKDSGIPLIDLLKSFANQTDPLNKQSTTNKNVNSEGTSLMEVDEQTKEATSGQEKELNGQKENAKEKVTNKKVVNSKRKHEESGYHLHSTKHKKYSPQIDQIKRFMRKKKEVNYKEKSSNESSFNNDELNDN